MIILITASFAFEDFQQSDGAEVPELFSSSKTPLPEPWWFQPQGRDLFLEDDYFESFITRKWVMVSPEKLSLGKDPNQAKAYVVYPPCFASGRQLDVGACRKIEGTWVDNRKEGVSNTSKGINAKFLDKRMQRQSWYHLCTAAGEDETARLVDSRRPRPGMRSEHVSPPNHLHVDDERVAVTDKPHKNDDLRIQHAQEVRVTTQHASGPATGFSSAQDQKQQKNTRKTDKPKGNWNRKSSQILQTYKESRHTVVLGTLFEQGNPSYRGREKKASCSTCEPRDRQHEVQADRVSEPLVSPTRHHEVHGWLAGKDPH